MSNFVKISTLMFGILLSACSMESGQVGPETKIPEGGDGGDDVEAGVSLVIPGGFNVFSTRGEANSQTSSQVDSHTEGQTGSQTGSQTRALTDGQEKSVEDAWVFAFTVNGVLVRMTKVTGAGITPDGQSNRVGIRAKLPAGNHNVVVVANASVLVEREVGRSIDEVATLSYEYVMGRLVQAINTKMSPWFTESIPMWGESGVVRITEGADISIPLYRSVARIDVGVGAWDGEAGAWTGLDAQGAWIPFRMTEVYVMRAGKRYAVAPDRERFEAGLPSLTFADGETFTARESVSGFMYSGEDVTVAGPTSFTTRAIYVPEIGIKNTAHEERMALVVGGEWGGRGPTTYYRVDFNKQDEGLVDVVRNHLYRFSIGAVHGPGFADPVAAYEAASTNIEATVTDWSDRPFEDIHFHGDKFFGLSDNPVELGSEQGAKRTVLLRTNISTFTLTLQGGAAVTLQSTVAQGAAGGDMVQTADFKYTLRSGGAQGEWTLEIETLSANDSASTAKVESWDVDADSFLKFLFEVRQAWGSPYSAARSVTIGPSTVFGTEDPGAGTAIANAAAAAIGSEVTVQAASTSGMVFSGWVATGITITKEMQARPVLTFEMPDADVVIAASFLPAEVKIGNYIWSMVNVDTPGRFAASAGNLGRLYQFGSESMPEASRLVGWANVSNTAALADMGSGAGVNAAGAGVAWSAAANYTSPAWSPEGGWVYDPCPVGWRVPSWEEWGDLRSNTDSGMSQQNLHSENGVRGRLFTASDGSGNRLFLPLTGYRLHDQGNAMDPTAMAGYYWSSSLYNGDKKYGAVLMVHGIVQAFNHESVAALAVRCVRSVGGSEYTVTASTPGGGGTAVAGESRAEVGESVRVHAVAGAGMVFAGWSSDDVTITAADQASPTLTFTMPARAVHVEAAFLPAEVRVGDLVWSAVNVDAPGTFAPAIGNLGRLYQFASGGAPATTQQKTGWMGAGDLRSLEEIGPAAGVDSRGWDVPFGSWSNATWSAVGGWIPAYDPCPAGWRMPTGAEFRDMLDNTKDVAADGMQVVGGVTGAEFRVRNGDTSKTLFFQRTGLRQSADGSPVMVDGTNVGTLSGIFWSSSMHYDEAYPTTTTRGTVFQFLSTTNSTGIKRWVHIDGYPTDFACAVRCVRDDGEALHSVIASSSGGGTVPVPNSSVRVGQRVTLRAVPDAGNVFAGWTQAEGITLTSADQLSPTITFTMPAGPVHVGAQFMASQAEVEGVVWATVNVGEPGKFVTSASDPGRLYQFGSAAMPAASRLVGWIGRQNTSRFEELGTGAGVDASGNGVMWSAANYEYPGPWDTAGGWAYDPCPDGWRVPSQQEWQSMLDAQGVEGAVPLPLAGYRSGNREGQLYDYNNSGFYWTSTPHNAGQGCAIYIFGTYVASTEYPSDTRSLYSVRCVRK